MKIDILAIGAHPDDVELGCSGTIAKEIANNKKVGILDLTKGELGTRGSAEIREKEANDAAKVLNVAFRENLNFNFSSPQIQTISFPENDKPQHSKWV